MIIVVVTLVLVASSVLEELSRMWGMQLVGQRLDSARGHRSDTRKIGSTLGRGVAA